MGEFDLKRKYNISRSNLLILIILSVINIGTIIYNDSYFLFSLTFPRFVQTGIDYLIQEEIILDGQINYTIIVVIMLIPIALFLLCYIFTSKNRYKVFIFAIVLLGIDSIFTLIVFDFIDIAFHAYIFVLFALGIKYGHKLKYYAYANETNKSSYNNNDEISEIIERTDSPKLRADSPKGRILINTTFNGFTIVVKRRYKLTELIINGYVYAEYYGLVETSYKLMAAVNSTNITFVLEGAKMNIFVNDNKIITKIRFF